MVNPLSLALRRRSFLARDGLARAFARARIGMCALAMHRQISPMPQTAVRAHVQVPLDVPGHLTP